MAPSGLHPPLGYPLGLIIALYFWNHFSPTVFGFFLLFEVGFFPLSRHFGAFFSMVRSYKRTVVLYRSVFPDNVKSDDLASKIVTCFGSANVLSSQFSPGRVIRVTFENEPFAENVMRETSLTTEVCSFMGEGPRTEYVLISLYSFKAESAPLTEELSKYGEVQGILFREWIQLDDVMDGARVVCMTHSGRVPRSLHINDHL